MVLVKRLLLITQHILILHSPGCSQDETNNIMSQSSLSMSDQHQTTFPFIKGLVKSPSPFQISGH